jgi:hypothetical protein
VARNHKTQSFAASRFSLVVVSRPQTGSIYLIAVHIGIHFVGRL